mgnify:CR=1 FL=1
MPLFRMTRPVDVVIEAGEQVAVVGPNGAGKSILVDLLTGAKPLLRDEPAYDFGAGRSKSIAENVKYIAFRDAYGDAQTPAYYQQRWNQGDDTPWPTVRELLAKVPAADPAKSETLRTQLGVDLLLDKPIIQLSSGELRRFQLAQALQSFPCVLVIDNPFIGLDQSARTMLTRLLASLSSVVTLILVMARREDIPEFITHVIPVETRTVHPKTTREDFLRRRSPQPTGLTQAEQKLIQDLPAHTRDHDSESVVTSRHITIQYGTRKVLDSLTWNVNKGEHWALTGENGAGKSTLLSLVCADNPQAYACDIDLFGRRRGTGESIWEIKRHIGYVSPEMFRSYKKNLLTADIIASGLHDTIGLYRRITEEERAACNRWIEIFGLGKLADRPYLSLSSGEQRMVLLSRAFVKDPELLILDEPFHGLDNHNRKRARDIIEAFCRRPNKTLIMVTHYEDELPSCIDHRLHLKKNL